MTIKVISFRKTLGLLCEIKNRACSLSEMFECKDYQVRSDLLNSALWS